MSSAFAGWVDGVACVTPPCAPLEGSSVRFKSRIDSVVLRDRIVHRDGRFSRVPVELGFSRKY